MPPSVTVSPAPDLSIRIPKNKSTGNLLATQKEPVSAEQGRLRFSFDAGTQQGVNAMRRYVYSCDTRNMTFRLLTRCIDPLDLSMTMGWACQVCAASDGLKRPAEHQR